MVTPLSLFVAAISLPLLYVALKVWHTLWWRPKGLERQLRQQGIRGNPYRVLYGDLKEQMRSIMEAWSKPTDLGHRIAWRALPFVHETVEKYGKISLVWEGTTPRIIVKDPDMIREILLDRSGIIIKPPINNPLVNLLANGVSSLEGQEWVKRRKVINPAFHIEKLKGMLPAFSTSCIELINRWEKMVGVRGVHELDVSSEFESLTGDVISRSAFGSSYQEGRRIFELQKEQAVLVMDAARSPYIPGFRFIPTVKNRRRMYLDREIKSMLKNLIRKKEQSMKAGESYNGDLLGLLLQHTDVFNTENNKETYMITIDDVIEACKLFYFAGQETTSIWLTWTMVLLALHPDWQQKAREEVLRVLGDHQPNFESLNHLKIVTMILNEVHRLYPPVAALLRYAPKGIKVGGFEFPPGVQFLLATIFEHHSPKHWGEDASEFKPERFAEGISTATKDRNLYIPFGLGPRICLGQNFAYMEAKMALSMILQRFSFELSPSYAHAPYTIITLKPQYGAQIILKKI